MHPILFQLGPIALYSYGLMVAIGYLVAVALAAQRARRVGIDPTRIQTLSWVVLLMGLIGARAAYVFLYWDLFRFHPVEVIRLDHGGLVFYGGLLGGIGGGLWYVRRSGLPLWPTVDLMIPPLVLGHALGRIGCFLNGCCYGKPTALPWGVPFLDGVVRHPTQWYESAALILLLGWLKIVERRNPKPGTVALTYGLLYGSWRFFVEFLRGDNPTVAWGLTVFQWVSVGLIVGCGWVLVRRLKSGTPFALS